MATTSPVPGRGHSAPRKSNGEACADGNRKELCKVDAPVQLGRSHAPTDRLQAMADRGRLSAAWKQLHSCGVGSLTEDTEPRLAHKWGSTRPIDAFASVSRRSFRGRGMCHALKWSGHLRVESGRSVVRNPLRQRRDTAFDWSGRN